MSEMNDTRQMIANLLSNKLKKTVTAVAVESITDDEITGICTAEDKQIAYRIIELEKGGYTVEVGEEVTE
jgi:hypothetical protein